MKRHLIPAYRLAPNESLLRPAPASSLVPWQSEAARRPVNAGLVLIVATLAALTQAQLQGAVIAVASLGLPLLLIISWTRAGALSTMPRWTVGVSSILAVGIAVGWVLSTGDLVVRQAGSAFDAGSAGRRVLRDGLGVAEGGALLMLVPVAAIALLWRSRRDPRDGFTLGALGALLFGAAATLTRLAPQLLSAPVARNQPVRWLLLEAAVRGVAVPMTAACAGGLVGAAVWTFRRASRRTTAAVSCCAAGVLAVYVLVGRADVEGVSPAAALSWHGGMAVAALIAVRLGLQRALADQPPEADPAVTAARPARPLATWLTVIGTASALLIGLQALLARPVPRYDCPPDCGRPPSGTPVSANPRFTAPGGQFSVAYPAPGGDFAVSTNDTGVTARFTAGDGGVMRLTGEPAAGRSARQVAEDFLAAKVPTAQPVYEIPNAKLGFRPGYGVVADVFPPNPQLGVRDRAVVIVAVRNDFALIAGGLGPYRQFGPGSGPGRPSPANVQIAEEMGRYVNSFMWAGDPPR